jgi:hypothetical protein
MDARFFADLFKAQNPWIRSFNGKEYENCSRTGTAIRAVRHALQRNEAEKKQLLTTAFS